MKKIGYLFLLFFILLLGVSIASQDTVSQADDIQDKIEDFEKNINQGNNITSKSDNAIDPSIANKSAKTCENIVNTIIEKIFDFLEK